MKTILAILFIPWAIIQLILTGLYLPVMIFIFVKNWNKIFNLEWEFKNLKISKPWYWWNCLMTDRL